MEETTNNQQNSELAQQKKLKEEIDSKLSDKLSVADSLKSEFGLCYTLAVADVTDVFKILKEDEAFKFQMLVDVTAVDWLDKREPRFDVVYQLLSIGHNHRLCIKVAVDEDKAEVDSLVPLWPAANFLEREVWDMYGIVFKGHPELKRILMYDEFVGHPLRKDYPIRAKQPRVKMRIPELRNTSNDMKREQLVSLPVRQRMGDLGK